MIEVCSVSSGLGPSDVCPCRLEMLSKMLWVRAWSAGDSCVLRRSGTVLGSTSHGCQCRECCHESTSGYLYDSNTVSVTLTVSGQLQSSSLIPHRAEIGPRSVPRTRASALAPRASCSRDVLSHAHVQSPTQPQPHTRTRGSPSPSETCVNRVYPHDLGTKSRRMRCAASKVLAFCAHDAQSADGGGGGHALRLA